MNSNTNKLLKCHSADCSVTFTTNSNRKRHEKKFGHSPASPKHINIQEYYKSVDNNNIIEPVMSMEDVTEPVISMEDPTEPVIKKEDVTEPLKKMEDVTETVM